jgi:hypothetical protein
MKTIGIKGYAQETITHYELKPGTKTAWQEVKTETRDITEQQYTNCVEAAPFFRRLGGSEYLERGYTSRGYLVTRIISKSPDRTKKTIRIFKFN